MLLCAAAEYTCGTSAIMISSKAVIDHLNQHGFGPFLGVPCSFLSPFINYVIDRDDLDYLAANNEGEAIAMATGAYLAGKKPVVMFQNSGLGNAVNPLTSLAHTFRIPLLLIVTWRGEPRLKDEPQHTLMGQITHDLLKLMQIESATFPQADEQLAPQMQLAMQQMASTGQPFAFVMPKGTVAKYELQSVSVAPSVPRGQLLGSQPNIEAAPTTALLTTASLSRTEAIHHVLQQMRDETLVIAGTGKIGRELFALADRPNHFYMVGSMGCASSVGLGVALYQPDKPVVVLDGDGAALMRLEAMVGVGHYQPRHFIHIILDNEVHDSTGGQQSLSPTVHLGEVAVACGYRSACTINHADEFADALKRVNMHRGPHLIHLKIKAGSPADLGRPTITPTENAARFRRCVLS